MMDGAQCEKVTDMLTKNCNVPEATFEFHTNLMGAQSTEYSVEKLAQTGFASNCAATSNDPNQATHKILAKCNPMYDMRDKETGATTITVSLPPTHEIKTLPLYPLR